MKKWLPMLFVAGVATYIGWVAMSVLGDETSFRKLREPALKRPVTVMETVVVETPTMDGRGRAKYRMTSIYKQLLQACDPAAGAITMQRKFTGIDCEYGSDSGHSGTRHLDVNDVVARIERGDTGRAVTVLEGTADPADMARLLSWVDALEIDDMDIARMLPERTPAVGQTWMAPEETAIHLIRVALYHGYLNLDIEDEQAHNDRLSIPSPVAKAERCIGKIVSEKGDIAQVRFEIDGEGSLEPGPDYPKGRPHYVILCNTLHGTLDLTIDRRRGMVTKIVFECDYGMQVIGIARPVHVKIEISTT